MWKVVPKAASVDRGDVIIWLMPDSLDSENTGHVMIATGPATKNSDRDDEWMVPIVDATSEGHGPGDKRAAGADEGVGTGVIGILVAKSGKSGNPVAYTWAGGKSRDRLTTVKIGRVVYPSGK